jgi:Ca2+-binding EF-hand superfamily protein
LSAKAQSDALESMKSFVEFNKMRRSAIKYMANNLETDQIKELTVLFEKMDKNKDGQIDAKEAEEGFRKISLD